MNEPRTPEYRAVEEMDWVQVVMNGGPPCFHLEQDGRFCGRAEKWVGHASTGKHGFISLARLLRTSQAAAVLAALEGAAQTFDLLHYNLGLPHEPERQDEYRTWNAAMKRVSEILRFLAPTKEGAMNALERVKLEARLEGMEYAHDSEEGGGCYICKEMFSPEECMTLRTINELRRALTQEATPTRRAAQQKGITLEEKQP